MQTARSSNEERAIISKQGAPAMGAQISMAQITKKSW